MISWLSVAAATWNGGAHDRAEEGGVETVEFRIDTHREKLGERLLALQAVDV